MTAPEWLPGMTWPRGWGKRAAMVRWAAQHLIPADLQGDQSRHVRQRYVLGMGQTAPVSLSPSTDARSVVAVSGTAMEDIVTRLAQPVTASHLRSLVDAAHDNEMDLAHLLLRVEMPPVVGDMSLGQYAAELASAAGEARAGLDGQVYASLLDLGATALNDAQ